MKTLDILAVNLRRLREGKGFSQMELAEEIGVAHTSLSRWETAKLMPKHENLDAIADFYSVSVSALFSEELTTYKKANPNPTLEALSELVVEQKQKLKDLELSDNEKRIIDEYRRAQPLQKMAIETMAGFGLDKNPDAEILNLMKEVNSKAGSKKTS